MIRAQRSDGRADIVIASTEYQRIAVARAVDHVLTVEDVLIHKLIAWRPRDQDDVRSILSTDLADLGRPSYSCSLSGSLRRGETPVRRHHVPSGIDVT